MASGSPERVACPHCQALVKTSRLPPGSLCTCPKCGQPFPIPGGSPAAVPPVPPAEKKSSPLPPQLSPPPVSSPERPVAIPAASTSVPPAKKEAAESKPTPAPPRADEEIVPVVCSLCGTRMYAKPAQIGKRVQCPDCHSPVEVRPLKAGTSSAPATTASALRPPGTRQVPASAPAVAATSSNGGEDDLAIRDEEPRPRPPSPLPGTLDEDESEMLLRAPEIISVPKPVLPRLEDIKEENEYQDDWSDEALDKEIRPFTSGIFSFLIRPEALTRLIAYSLGAAVLSAMWHFTVALLLSGGLIGMLVGLMLLIASGLATVLYGIALSVVYLIVVQDTAHGHQTIENWPDMNFFNWALDARYVVLALGIASIPGGLISSFLFSGAYPWAHPAWMGPVTISQWIFAPAILLSMLEGGSIFTLASGRVIESIRRSADGAIIFYVQTAFVMLGVFGMFFLQVQPNPIVPMAAAAVLVALYFVYFRLVGRLMWYCNLRGPEAESAEFPPGHPAAPSVGIVPPRKGV